MRRARFITLLGGAAAAWPLAARAQQRQAADHRVPGRDARVRTRVHGPPAFVERLRELGWIEGRTVAIEYRWAEGRTERFAEFAAEFVRPEGRCHRDAATPVARSQAGDIDVIPIVFAIGGGPGRHGLVASLARPGGNVTGLSSQTSDLAGKRIELLREIVPALRRLAILADVGYPSTVKEMRRVPGGSRSSASTSTPLKSAERRTSHRRSEGSRAARRHFLLCSTRCRRQPGSHRHFGARRATADDSDIRDFSTSGGLMSYGAHPPDLFRRAADLVDKVLRGAKPGDIPVEQPTKFDLVINLTTAKALGLTIPSLSCRSPTRYRMKRREVIACSAARLAWPPAARAQQPALPVVGFLRNTAAIGYNPIVTAFARGLKEAGFVDGQERRDRVPLG